MDAFSEALAVVPVVHMPVTPGQQILLLGPGSAAAADIVLRYPTTAAVAIVGDTSTSKDRRVQVLPSLDTVPSAWADLAVVVIPVLTDAIVKAVYARHRPGSGLAVFAVANPTQVGASRDLVKATWSVVQPYREHTATGPAWFLLAGEHGFKRHRPMPGWTGRLTDKYLPALFTLAKDEYAGAFGQQRVP
jgi:hypothetical protein